MQKGNDPFFYFEFANERGMIEPLLFADPVKIIQADTIEEVIPALEEIQDGVQEGLYAAGFLSYEAAPAFDKAMAVRSGGAVPYLWFGLFREPCLSGFPPDAKGRFAVSEWVQDTSVSTYYSSIATIKDAIRNGDTYQVNYTIRLRAKFQGDDFAFFQRLFRAQRANYCAYLNIGRYRVLSASPELFFRWNGKKIIARPMKGTIKRGRWLEEDQRNLSILKQSEKDRAENVMIVDLLRNDLGRIAERGSVTVTSLFDIERYPTVFQMTSAIEAVTRSHIGLKDIFTALFPCGSITGAPKVSTMNIIADLEQSPRGIYCGAIGYLAPNGEAIFNVPIRTVVIDAETGIAEYGVGGGVTWDSTSEGEYEEALAKAMVLTAEQPEFHLLESIRLKKGEYFLLERHLQRLKESAEYFQFDLSLSKVGEKLYEFARLHSSGVWKVRLLAGENGEIHVEGEPIQPLEIPLPVALAHEPVSKNHRFLYHKTTHREVYESQRSRHEDVFDVLLWNEEGELTEFTTGNVVLEMGGQKYTPPRECGLLAGTFRAELLDRGEMEERVLTHEDLKLCSRIWLINSVRGWVPVYLVN